MTDAAPVHGLEASRTRLRRLAWLLDSSIPLPGGFSIGLDGLIGLVPGIGDVLGACFSSYIIAEAARAGAPVGVLARMGLNVAIETIVGAIPVLGDLFDFAFKANVRNVALMDRHAADPQRTRVRSAWVVASVVAVLLLLLLLALTVVVEILQLLWARVTV